MAATPVDDDLFSRNTSWPGSDVSTWQRHGVVEHRFDQQFFEVGVRRAATALIVRKHGEEVRRARASGPA
jgi:hypothetical protein